MLKLIGVLLVAVGFLFRLNTQLVVTVAGIVTDLLSSFTQVGYREGLTVAHLAIKVNDTQIHNNLSK